MMRWPAYAAIACFACCPAYADLQDDEHRVMESYQRILKVQYRSCARDADCSMVRDVCSGYLAVNYNEKPAIAKLIGELAAASDCATPQEPEAPEPVAVCLHHLCELPAHGGR